MTFQSGNNSFEQSLSIRKQVGFENLTRLDTLYHANAGQFVMQDVDLPTVMKMMGHADIQTTTIYSYSAPDHLADAVNEPTF